MTSSPLWQLPSRCCRLLPLLSSRLMCSSSLGNDDIPHKLKCAVCSKIAINAFKTPCCDQAICEPCMILPIINLMRVKTNLLTGFQRLGPSCPCCDHSPLPKEECKPFKTLRGSVKAFLKSKEKSRGRDLAPTTTKSATSSTPIVPEASTKQPPAEQVKQEDSQNAVLPEQEKSSETPVAQAPTPAGALTEAVRLLSVLISEIH